MKLWCLPKKFSCQFLVHFLEDMVLVSFLPPSPSFLHWWGCLQRATLFLFWVTFTDYDMGEFGFHSFYSHSDEEHHEGCRCWDSDECYYYSDSSDEEDLHMHGHPHYHHNHHHNHHCGVSSQPSTYWIPHMFFSRQCFVLGSNGLLAFLFSVAHSLILLR